MIDRARFADALRRSRLAAGFSGVDAAAVAVGVDARSLERYEAGVSLPRLEILVEVCATYHVSADALLGLVECACGLTYRRDEIDRHAQACEERAA